MSGLRVAIIGDGHDAASAAASVAAAAPERTVTAAPDSTLDAAQIVVLDGAAPRAHEASAQRDALLARASVLVCTASEAVSWLAEAPAPERADAPMLAKRLRAAGAAAVCIVGSNAADGARCWLDTEHARGWLTSANGAAVGPRAAFTARLARALTRGFVVADAAVIAVMAAGTDEGNRGNAEFINERSLLPCLSWSEQSFVEPAQGAATARSAPAHAPARASRPLDLYAIVDSAARVEKVLAAGIRTVQLRIKTDVQSASPMDAQTAAQAIAALRDQIRRSVAACRAAGAELFVNDHWRLAAEEGAGGVHLGQEDLLALGDEGRADLLSRGLALGISSHSLWELCRARTLHPRYVACGPVWPTLTKAMPWHAQGLDNLSWWCRVAPAPVVAIGGILEADKVRQAASCGADGVCIVRGLGEDPGAVVPALQRALTTGRSEAAAHGDAHGAVHRSVHRGEHDSAPGWPHPSLSLRGRP